MRLVAFLDFDQELLAPRFRAAEQALWLLVRAALLGSRPGAARSSCRPGCPTTRCSRAAVAGDVATLAADERARRRALGFPPFGGLAELRGDDAAVAAACEPAPGFGRGARPDVRTRAGAGVVDHRAVRRARPRRPRRAARALGRLRVDVDPLRV